MEFPKINEVKFLLDKSSGQTYSLISHEFILLDNEILVKHIKRNLVTKIQNGNWEIITKEEEISQRFENVTFEELKSIAKIVNEVRRQSYLEIPNNPHEEFLDEDWTIWNPEFLEFGRKETELAEKRIEQQLIEKGIDLQYNTDFFVDSSFENAYTY